MPDEPIYLTEAETTDAKILARLLGRVPADLDAAEGSYIYDALAPVAIELALAAIMAQEVLRRGFASTTFGTYLDMRCAEHGITRRPAVRATGQVTFTGTPGASIPAGTLVSTVSSDNPPAEAITFLTLDNVEIGPEGSVTVVIEAVEAGAAGNVLAGTITVLAQPLPGVAAVTNAAPTAGGLDAEDDASLLARYLLYVRTPGTSGNRADYLRWALEVPGVGAAHVMPLWNGPGTVKVVLLGTDKLPASQAIVDAVQAYIAPTDTGDGKAPVGATVTVVAATPVAINVSATVILTGTKTLAEVQAAFEAALTEYLADIAFSDDPTVRYVKIGSLLLDTPGVQDYTNLLINSGTGNIVIADDEVAVKGTVTLNE